MSVITAHGSDGSIVFRRVFFSVNTITHELLHLAWRNFCTNIYLNNVWNPIEFWGHRSHRFFVYDIAAIPGCVNMYLENLWKPIAYQGHGPVVFCAFFICM